MTDLITTPETFWNSLREQLLEVIPADTFRVWFDNMRIGRLDDDGCELIAPNEFSAIWIRDNYLDVIRQEGVTRPQATGETRCASEQITDDSASVYRRDRSRDKFHELRFRPHVLYDLRVISRRRGGSGLSQMALH